MRVEKRKKKRKVLFVILVIVVVFVFGIGGYVYYLWYKVVLIVVSIYECIDKFKKRDIEVNINKKDLFFVLIMGVDECDGDKGCVDMFIYMIVNLKMNIIDMVSILCDIYIKIIGKGIMDKINYLYVFGGM